MTLSLSTSNALAVGSKFQFPAEGIAFYVGTLTDADVDGFITAAAEKGIKQLLITSPGGTMLAGIKLGRWVMTNNAEVVVDKLCMSSCANYVFPAGSKKIIRPDSLVIWHGGAEQKDFRELRERMSRVVRAKTLHESLSKDDERFYVDNAAQSKLWDTQTQAQRVLFSDLGVDEYITRLGQEPVAYGVPWTTTTDTMKLFGVGEVLADERYGTGDYIARVAKKIGLRSNPVLLKATRNNGGFAIEVLP
jgi:hypothetical protein